MSKKVTTVSTDKTGRNECWRSKIQVYNQSKLRIKIVNAFVAFAGEYVPVITNFPKYLPTDIINHPYANLGNNVY